MKNKTKDQGQQFIEFLCYYCHNVIRRPEPDIALFVLGNCRRGRYTWLPVIHCETCEDRHKEAMADPEKKKEYKLALLRARDKFRKQIRAEAGISKKPAKSMVYEKDGFVFRDNVNLGKIIGRNGVMVYTQKSPLDSVNLYQLH